MARYMFGTPGCHHDALGLDDHDDAMMQGCHHQGWYPGDDNGDDYNQDDINAGDLTVSEGSLVPSLLARESTSTGGFVDQSLSFYSHLTLFRPKTNCA